MRALVPALLTSVLLTSALGVPAPAPALGAAARDTAARAAVTPAPRAPAQEDCGRKQFTKPDGSVWACTFADDFEGKRLDTTKWQAIRTATSGFTSGNECFRAGKDNVRVSGGKLRLTIRKLKKPVSCAVARGRTFTTRYTAGSVTTHDIFSQTYGRFEVRAKFPSSKVKGLQSAVWLTPQNPRYGAWPRSGEIDVVEHYTHQPRRAIPYLHYMFGFAATPFTSQTNNHCMIGGKAKFHKYVLVWEPGRIRVWVDGEACIDHVVRPMLPWFSPQPFDHPFVFNLTHMLGVADNAFDPARTEVPSTFVVDYWRAWR